MHETKHQIELRGVRTHNLKGLDLDIEHGQFISVCGVSGSGKSSLAFDTLFAEGQRRYFETVSSYKRQFLEKLDKPDADRIDGIPPAISVRGSRASAREIGNRHQTTVGTSSEVVRYLRLLFAKSGQLICPDCSLPVVQNDLAGVVAFLQAMPEATRFQICFEIDTTDPDDWGYQLDDLRSSGFRRLILDGQSLSIEENVSAPVSERSLVVVDRLVTGKAERGRIEESLETTFKFGRTVILSAASDPSASNRIEVDGKDWQLDRFFGTLSCRSCHRTFPEKSGELFDFGSPLGACQECNGFGATLKLDDALIFPDHAKSLRDGAVAPWTTPAYRHELEELVELAGEYDVPLDIPFSELPAKTIELIWSGVPEREFGGLNGFFAWLERRKYKIQIAVFLNRWKTSELCVGCQGGRLNQGATAYRIGDQNIAQLCGFEIRQLFAWVSELELSADDRNVSGKIIDRISAQLDYLNRVGVGYLTLNRHAHTLSTGEATRVTLTRILGTSLTNMLYVLDEPTVGLHPSDVASLVQAIGELHQRDNTVVVVDHDETMIMAAERVIEIGPGAGESGGEIVFDGTPNEMVESEESLTGNCIRYRRRLREDRSMKGKPRKLKLRGASGNNLQDVTVEFPLGCLCVVAGVSGSGKSSLVHETLYPALAAKLEQNADTKSLPCKALTGFKGVSEVIMVDQSPIGRSSRSNPVTYVKAFDEIRKAFASTADAKAANLKAGHFSFNVEGGRCDKCKGEGQLTIDMQFMSDLHIRCDQCNGTRFREEVLKAKFRARNIDDVLNMSVHDAFSFFRGQKKVQTKLKALMDVGLDYVRLGQSANSLSTGEAQRLKLAHYLNRPGQQRVLFIMDEPTFGLHMRDVVKLVDCFNTLLDAGHSLIVIEHNLELIQAADWIIEMGPGAAAEGGNIVATGTADQIEKSDTATGRCLQQLRRMEQAAI